MWTDNGMRSTENDMRSTENSMRSTKNGIKTRVGTRGGTRVGMKTLEQQSGFLGFGLQELPIASEKLG